MLFQLIHPLSHHDDDQDGNVDCDGHADNGCYGHDNNDCDGHDDDCDKRDDDGHGVAFCNSCLLKFDDDNDCDGHDSDDCDGQDDDGHGVAFCCLAPSITGSTQLALPLHCDR